MTLARRKLFYRCAAISQVASCLVPPVGEKRQLAQGGTSLSAEENMALARRFMEARVKGDVAALDEMLPPDFISHSSVIPGQQSGREGLKRAMPEADAMIGAWMYSHTA